MPRLLIDRRGIDPNKVKRVLIYRLGSLGDTLVALPAFHLIERTFPNARRMLLTNIPILSKAPAAQAILDGSNLIHGSFSYPMATRSPGLLLRLAWQIRSFRPQLLIYMMGSRGELSLRRDLRFFRFCGLRDIIGLPVGELADYRFDPATGLWESEAARLLRCLAPLGRVSIDDPAGWDLHLTPLEKQSADATLAPLAGAPLIACGPGTKMQAKDWGEENWCALLGKLSTHLRGHALILVGSADDRPAAERVAGSWHGKALNLCGSLSPRHTAAVLEHARLFLGPDSGPMHLAAVSGVPCAIAFSARQNPGIWFPPGARHRIVYHRVNCQDCLLEVCIENQRRCLTSITVDEMFSAAIEAWKNGQQQRDSRLA